jgi:single-stranded-DNA-specific exonuclease
MNKRWKIQGKEITGENPEERQEEIIQQLLQNRGLDEQAEKEQFFSPPHPKEISLDEVKIEEEEVKKSCQRIKKAVADKELIIIYGDYDADGICASAILWETLNNLGAEVYPFMPHRERHGYGLNKKGLNTILSEEKVEKWGKQPGLIITVDNGIVAHEGVEFAEEKGLDVIVSDHHQQEATLPDADAVVWSDQIAGAGVAWFLARELVDFFKADEAAKKQLNTDLLALAAVGTITDMMPLLGLNRSFVKHGLQCLGGIERAGLQALYKQAGIEQKQEIEAYHVGFIIGPRLNAMGRLEHAIDSLRLLCTTDSNRGESLAEKLGDTNKQRQDLTRQTFIHAKEMVKAEKEEKNYLLVGDASYDPGIIGLVAGKLVNQFYKPALVFNQGEEFTKLSARSVKGFNIIEALRGCGDLFEDIGGHPMAAGLTIRTEKLSEFEKAFSEIVAEELDEKHLTPILNIDCQIKLDDVIWDLQEKISSFAPFGYGNPRPVFMIKGLRILSLRRVGSNGGHLKMKLDDPETPEIEQTQAWLDAIGFNLGYNNQNINQGDTVDIAFNIDKNTWNGNTTLQLKVKEIKKSDKED